MRQLKSRPALVLFLAGPYSDPVVCGISTQLHQEVKGLDDLVAPGDVDFVSTGLKAPSLIRLCYMSVLMPQQIKGRLGRVDDKRLKRLLERLSLHLGEAAKRLG